MLQTRPLTLRPASPAERPLALHLQYTPLGAARDDAVVATVIAAEKGTVDLSPLLVALEGDRIVGALLTVPQPDHVAVLWPPVALDVPDAPAIRSALAAEAVAQLAQMNVAWGQCLVDPSEPWTLDELLAAGFQHGADLFFLGRTLDDLPSPTPPPADLDPTTEEYPAQSPRFAAVVEQSYEASADCPLLCDRRSGAQSLQSHAIAGTYKPDWWRLYRMADADAAVLILADHPDEEAVELVYMGVAPQFRGRGLGRTLVEDALRIAHSASRKVLFLAVDARNQYANSVYAALGFTEIARRTVYLWLPASPACK